MWLFFDQRRVGAMAIDWTEAVISRHAALGTNLARQSLVTTTTRLGTVEKI